jgi:cation-transporting ATPase 13A1
MESGLTFGGFLVLQCPLKPASQRSVQELLDSSHRVVMITGDHALTACHVAQELNILTKPTLMLTPPPLDKPDQACSWEAADGSTGKPWGGRVTRSSISALIVDHDLCMTGDVMEHLRTVRLLPDAELALLVEAVAVFARTSPDQKAYIVTALKSLGHMTLMCGDGMRTTLPHFHTMCWPWTTTTPLTPHLQAPTTWAH